MLTELTVQNFALLEDVRLELSSGFTVLTGETGAGKSIILDALGLVLGRRADAGQIRQGAERLTVTARFEGADPRLKKITTELGLENEGGEGWLVRRDVDVSGRSRAFVNDQPVSVAALSRLGEILVYIHGQNEHQTLLKSAEQRILLDDFSGLTSRCAAVALAWDLWKKKSAEADALVVSEQEQAQRLDLYRFQKKELDGADVRLDEEEEWNVLLPS